MPPVTTSKPRTSSAVSSLTAVFAAVRATLSDEPKPGSLRAVMQMVNKARRQAEPVPVEIRETLDPRK